MDLMLNNMRQSKAFSVLNFAEFARRDLAIHEANPHHALRAMGEPTRRTPSQDENELRHARCVRRFEHLFGLAAHSVILQIQVSERG